MISDYTLSVLDECDKDTLHRICRELLQLREDERTPCRWEHDMDGNWQTGCDNMFVLNDGTPAENRMKFCPYCGHQIEEMP